MRRRVIKDAMTPFPLLDYGEHFLIKQLREYYPNELGYTVKNMCFPWVGYGEVMFDVMCNKEFDAVYASDDDIHLRNAYDQLRDYPTQLIAGLVTEEKKIRHCPTVDGMYNAYQEAQDRLRELHVSAPDSLESAVLDILFGNYVVAPYSPVDKRVLWVASELLTKVHWLSTEEMSEMCGDGLGVDYFTYFNYAYAVRQTPSETLKSIANNLDSNGTYLLYSRINKDINKECPEYSDALKGVSRYEFKYRNKFYGEAKYTYYIETAEGASIYTYAY